MESKTLLKFIESKTLLKFIENSSLVIDGEKHAEKLNEVSPLYLELLKYISSLDVETLSLPNNDLSLKSDELTNRLLSAKNVTKIQLTNNSVEVSGLSVLAHCLKENKRVKILDLSHNKINFKKEESWEIFESLISHCSLVQLNLSGNKLQNTAGTEIFHFLKTNTSLENLNLSYCGFTASVSSSIASAIEVNKTLRALNLLGNNLTADSQVEILHGLSCNLQLLSIELPPLGIESTDFKNPNEWKVHLLKQNSFFNTVRLFPKGILFLCKLITFEKRHVRSRTLETGVGSSFLHK